MAEWRKLRLMHLCGSVDVSTKRISRLIAKQTGFNWGKIQSVYDNVTETAGTISHADYLSSKAALHFHVNYRRLY